MDEVSFIGCRLLTPKQCDETCSAVTEESAVWTGFDGVNEEGYGVKQCGTP